MDMVNSRLLMEIFTRESILMDWLKEMENTCGLMEIIILDSLNKE